MFDLNRWYHLVIFVWNVIVATTTAQTHSYRWFWNDMKWNEMNIEIKHFEIENLEMTVNSQKKTKNAHSFSNEIWSSLTVWIFLIIHYLCRLLIENLKNLAITTKEYTLKTPPWGRALDSTVPLVHLEMFYTEMDMSIRSTSFVDFSISITVS